VTRRIIEPSHYVRGPKRRNYLFDFDAILQIRLVLSLRQAGVSLKTIGLAIDHLRKKRGGNWHSAWLLTDGLQVYEKSGTDGVVQMLGKKNAGQLVFAVIAVGPAEELLKQGLNRHAPVNPARYAGKVCRWHSGVAIPA
jgi:DNA-binding transcriptional MerR regulator